MITRKIMLSCAFFLLAHVSLIPMGEQQDASISKDPEFTPLEAEEELFNGVIKDDKTVTEVIQLSFFGHTKVGGIRRDDDDSVTTLSLANIKSITIQESFAVSQKYPEQEFARIQKVALDGTVTDGFLLPRHVIICGVEKKTGDEKAWYLNKINELIIQPVSTVTVADVVAVNTLPARPAPAPAAQQTNQASIPVDVVEYKISTQTTGPVAVVHDEYKEMALKVVGKTAEVINPKKTVIEAVTDVFAALVELIKALFNFVTGLFW